LLDVNHLLISERNVFDIAEKLSKFLLEMITLVSSVNKMGSEKVFIGVGRSLYIYKIKSKGPKLDSWGTPRFTVPHFAENFSKILFQFFMFYLSERL